MQSPSPAAAGGRTSCAATGRLPTRNGEPLHPATSRYEQPLPLRAPLPRAAAAAPPSPPPAGFTVDLTPPGKLHAALVGRTFLY